MNKKILYFLVVIFFFISSISNQTRGQRGWRSEQGFKSNYQSAPIISFNYGTSDVDLEDIKESFEDINLVEIYLGNMRFNSLKNSSSVLSYKSNYFSIMNITSEFSKSDFNKLDFNLWRFSLNRDNGYGYKIGLQRLIFYNSTGMSWSHLEVEDSIIIQEDKSKIDLYNNDIRFGSRAEGGIKLQVIPQLILDLNYERSIVFPRHLFWKATGSFLIEAFSQFFLDEFIDLIRESSPIATPIVNFILKNGLSYAIYEFRKEKMNWPFTSTSPLMNNSIKFGLTFVF